MDCTQKSYDGNVTVESTREAYYSNGYGNYGYDARDGQNANSQYTPIPWQIDALQKQQPELFQQDINSINAKLEEDNLLPGLKVVAMRDKDGIERDNQGRPVMRSVNEIKTLASDESYAIDKTAGQYTQAFDTFHQGFGGNNPLQIFWPEELTEDNIKQSLDRTDITSQQKATLQTLQDDFFSISTTAGNSDVITKDEISLWQNRQQENLKSKLDIFVENHPGSTYSLELQDANGQISIFDWNNKDNCALNYGRRNFGSYYPRETRGYTMPVPEQIPEIPVEPQKPSIPEIPVEPQKPSTPDSPVEQ